MKLLNELKTVENIKFFIAEAIYLIVLFTFLILKNSNIGFLNTKFI